jgi:pSer/pThr/pTyr-binding forkhead associated (FHA) protein
MAKLQILTGKRKGAVFELPNAVDIDIGNRKSAKLSIRDPWISYNHAKISKQGTTFVIEDLGSSNGTWINGEKIKIHELTTSVLIYFGKTKVRFTTDDSSSATGAKGEDTSPWWDKVLDDRKAGGAADPAKVRRLESELHDERRMREALEKFLSLPKGASVGNAARAGELEREVKELRARSNGGGEAVDTAALKAQAEKLRRENMSKTVELEGKVAHAESQVVELERRIQDKTEQAKKDVAKAREKVQAEIDELKATLEQEREAGKDLASGGDAALVAARERGDKLAGEVDEFKEKLRVAEERGDELEVSLKDAASPEQLETTKTQLWDSLQEAAKWKEQATQLAEEVEAAKEEYAAIVQEIDEISMEQIDVEDELNNRIHELEDQLGIPHADGTSSDG